LLPRIWGIVSLRRRLPSRRGRLFHQFSELWRSEAQTWVALERAL
jgi:hypothetical protein